MIFAFAFEIKATLDEKLKINILREAGYQQDVSFKNQILSRNFIDCELEVFWFSFALLLKYVTDFQHCTVTSTQMNVSVLTFI